MCDECRQYPHHPACPNAPSPRKYTECDICSKDILFGDEYYDTGENICPDCIVQFLVTAGDGDA